MILLIKQNWDPVNKNNKNEAVLLVHLTENCRRDLQAKFIQEFCAISLSSLGLSLLCTTLLQVTSSYGIEMAAGTSHITSVYYILESKRKSTFPKAFIVSFWVSFVPNWSYLIYSYGFHWFIQSWDILFIPRAITFWLHGEILSKTMPKIPAEFPLHYRYIVIGLINVSQSN